jgi:Archaea-specific editing domain of threonyl-tRNA synthetase
VDAFVAEPTERGRSKLADETPQTVRVEEALVVFAASEQADEPEPDAVAERAVAAVVDVAKRLGEQTIVLHSFAHLFVELSSPATAKAILDKMQSALEAQGYSVQQSAFGWSSLHIRLLVLHLPVLVERRLPHIASAHSHAA